MIRPEDIKVVAWDFDGVLNRNIENGVFAWARGFSDDLGLSLESFSGFLFQGRFQKAMVGEACLRELVTEWAGANGASGREAEILDYWFTRDALPDADVLAMVAQLRQRGIANVMATNNEIHRTSFIESDMGFDLHMDRIFAAGRMRVAKPDPDYFRHLERELGMSGQHMLLVDDMAENVESARRIGWQAFHFTEGAHDDLVAALGL
ncbi:MAG: HAD-IA family hydrolase [Alphaproteobacteria bacterium]|nr:HAD-IA family hydrolase [Alphaproteobacteria bacterium]MBU2084613.1 HAD-IA family hydrolase [Alphaproteobacteria bacterium]MBU2141976.1 HAD-IA family hydrolase [Alphaproteobacteria bacterium]MBU2198412.1 HAD-IA family hydrolase [Alphaproteobacteria bacterium]